MSKFRNPGDRSDALTATPLSTAVSGSLSHEQLGALYYRQGEKVKALEHYQEAAKQYPNDPAVLKALADFCYVGLGQPEESLEAYRRVLAVQPDDVAVLQIVGNIFVSLNRYAEARDHFTRLLALQPWNTGARKALEALPENGSKDPAVQELQTIMEDAQQSFDDGKDEGIDKAIDQILQFKERTARSTTPRRNHPSFEELRTIIASGDREKAVSGLEEFLAENPSHAEAQNALGVLHYQAGNGGRSLEHYRNAVELDPANIVYRKNYADYLYVFMQDPEEALRQYIAVLSAQPADIETLTALGILCTDLGKAADADFFFEKVLELEPWNQRTRTLRDSLKSVQHPREEVLDAERAPQDAQAAVTSGRSDDAIRLLEQVLQQQPDQAVAQNDLGVLYYQCGRKSEAGEHYAAAVRLDPDNPTFQKNLADFLFVEQGKAEDALKMYIQLLSRSPRDPDILIAIGRICEGVGRTDDAKDFYQKALESEPWNASAREQLRRLS